MGWGLRIVVRELEGGTSGLRWDFLSLSRPQLPVCVFQGRDFLPSSTAPPLPLSPLLRLLLGGRGFPTMHLAPKPSPKGPGTSCVIIRMGVTSSGGVATQD